MFDLIDILILLFGIIIFGAMLLASRQRVGMVQYPFLASAVMAGWVFPQLLGISVNYIVPTEAVAKTILFTCLCLIAGLFGYKANNRSARVLNWNFSERRLLFSSATLSAIGYFFWLKVFEMGSVATAIHGGAWSGVITIYVFFGNMLTIGLVVALVLHIHRPSLASATIIFFDLSLILERVFFQARREVMMELFVFSMLYLWWKYRWLPPRILIIGLIIGGTLIVNSVGDVRAALRSSQSEGSFFNSFLVLTDFTKYADHLKNSISDPSMNLELTNAALIIEGADRRASFDGGAYMWNRFVHNYVPGQIIGIEFKQSLIIDFEDVSFIEFGYISHPGSTHTGMADAFRSYWYFGAGIFFVIGFIMNRWFRAANEGSPVAQMIVMLITTQSLLAITHTTSHFFLYFISLLAFLLPLLFLSRANVVRRCSVIGKSL